LDTGRLHNDTYETMAKTSQKYGFNYEVYYPSQEHLEELIQKKGINLFYESVENRKACCRIRKVEPLSRALSKVSAWVTGLRKAQSVTRADIPLVEWDDVHQIIKINPLHDWSESDVWNYIKENSIPYNPLHDQGVPSIGCAPCTRAIKPGEDIRSGRWWWESPESKECGLHLKDGKLVSMNMKKEKETCE